MFFCTIYKIFKNTYFEEHLRTTASETYSFTSTALFENLHFWLKLVHMLYFLYHNLQFRLPILASLVLILLYSEAVVRSCFAKKGSDKFRKIHKKTSALKTRFKWICWCAEFNFIKWLVSGRDVFLWASRNFS